jgi:hypothetical protein
MPLAQPGTYLPVIDGPRIMRPDRNAEVIRRGNAAVRARSDRIILAGISNETYDAIMRVRELRAALWARPRCSLGRFDSSARSSDHVSGLVSAMRIVSATIRDDVSRINCTRREPRGSWLSGARSIARASAIARSATSRAPRMFW